MHKLAIYSSAATLIFGLYLPVTAEAASFPIRTRSTFNTIIAFRYREIDPTTGKLAISATGDAGLGPEVTISYDPLRDAYTIRDNSVTESFGRSSRSVSGFYNVYTTKTLQTSDRLALFNSSAASAPIKLMYLNFGSWSHTNLTSGDKNEYYFLYGFPTASSSMPRTGTASYTTFVTGNSVRTGAYAGTWQVGGNANFSANFAKGTVNTQLNLTRIDPAGNSVIGSFAGTGSIYAASQFTGNLTSSVPSFYAGSFAGGFFGPGAAEMGYGFGITLLQSDPYACAALPCAFQESIVGTVVGKK
jgi:C-lobe and N-lobe beta barrels of Tf-binding protein B